MRPSFGTNLPQIVTHIWQKAIFKHALGGKAKGFFLVGVTFYGKIRICMVV